ncbi:nucleotide sugar dehydrogenase [Seonamhaeicola aphaedonensis]|uniref:UDP-N-acetyl-D-galactosamine dehydrogenase n=1 Tax=Seonamhaeicola aphaedonensis TaxID=1461338 RepID=A0A3D9HHI8_9FLAO|nr:nucleotide sugar dehydrogenase [Seonamhaeicola aphaedonensis]RED48948.1 UDP-N-acetyl-D-galactosamine dehydrogenase [Seonamhaeicola aphaedonensis]
MEVKNFKIAIIGLGYVGLPLGIEFSKKGFDVVGYDVNKNRVKELNEGVDHTKEVTASDFYEATSIRFSSSKEHIKDANTYIVTVPTPIDEFNRPDLSFLIQASQTVGACLSKGDMVIYESTVYPGCTEEVCVPQLESSSGLKFNKDFYCGYSPERINPGDSIRKVHNIVKITSGSTPEIAEVVDNLYKTIVTVGTHKAPNMKVAEAGKIIENIQRDLNISLMNELALIFDRLHIDTLDVLEAAGTKWNFLPFRPGLVGGHCIGVDPYYLTHKAESLGYHPDVILSGRRVNDNMGVHVANKVIKLLVEKGSIIKGAKILVLGITFKENCPDIRNSRVIDVVRELEGFGAAIDVYDPHALHLEVKKEYNLELIKEIDYTYDAVVLAVGHDAFKSIDYGKFKENKDCVIYDVKSILPRDIVSARL